MPVGLLGLGSSTTDGRRSSTSSRAASRSSEKSSARWPVTHSVIASRAYSGYIEYVGANDSAHRPGPPKACSSCSITSLDPLAAHTMSAVMPVPPEVLRYAARPSRSSVNSRSG